MSLLRRLLKRALYGPVNYPQHAMLGLPYPQSEVDVWLHGLGEPRLVTNNHALTCCAPFTVGIGLCADDAVKARNSTSHLELRLLARSSQQVIGRIFLRCNTSIPLGEDCLCLFQSVGSRNYALSPLRIRAHLWQYARFFEPEKNLDVPISRQDAHALIVFFLCPRPIVLVSVVERDSGNIFPMNLMGFIGSEHFIFALNRHRCAAPLVERAGRAVLSYLPADKAELASRLGSNHRKPSIAWNDLPFMPVTLDGLSAPIPPFALQAQQMVVQQTHPLGSHTLFIAKMASRIERGEGNYLFNAHGLYHAWKHRAQK